MQMHTSSAAVRAIPYSRKIWRELNLADCLESARARILADLIWRFGIVSSCVYTRIRTTCIGGF